MADYTMTQGDTLRSIEATLYGPDGAVIDLTGCTVKFLMRRQNSAVLKVQSLATIVTAAAGIVRYSPLSGDVDTPGLYLGRWKVNETASDKDLTVPNSNDFTIHIRPDVE